MKTGNTGAAADDGMLAADARPRFWIPSCLSVYPRPWDFALMPAHTPPHTMGGAAATKTPQESGFHVFFALVANFWWTIRRPPVLIVLALPFLSAKRCAFAISERCKSGCLQREDRRNAGCGTEKPAESLAWGDIDGVLSYAISN